MRSRLLDWDGCLNVRDLGGLPTTDGGETLPGRIVRSDRIRNLTDAGWRAAAAHGVGTVVDLRFALERPRERPVPAGITVLRRSLFGTHDPAEAQRVDDLVRAEPDDASALARLYVETLDACASHVASAVDAVAAADDRCVLIHCYLGKDRTGIVTALLLLVAGVTPKAVADDYGLTDGKVGPLVDEWVAEATDDGERAFRLRLSAAPREAMVKTLELLEQRHGGAVGYLRDAGVGEEALTRVWRRLRAD